MTSRTYIFLTIAGVTGMMAILFATDPKKTSTGTPAADPVGVNGGDAKKISWDRPRFDGRRSERYRLVQRHIERASIPITRRSVLSAMREVPRHEFVPGAYDAVAYADRPIPIGHGQTISQPFIVAYMTELLEVEAGDKILEIGAGSGYQAAVLSEITPQVYTIEIIRELGEKTGMLLKKLGYNTISVKLGDGYFGWPEHAPFDAVIVTCAAGHVPPPLVKQLKPGGRMVIPVGGPYDVQMLVVVTKDESGNMKTRQTIPVRFVPMTGKSQD